MCENKKQNKELEIVQWLRYMVSHCLFLGIDLSLVLSYKNYSEDSHASLEARTPCSHHKRQKILSRGWRDCTKGKIYAWHVATKSLALH